MTVKPKARGAAVGAGLLSNYRFVPAGKIGHYACSDGRGRVIRCAFLGTGRPPRFVRVDCPHCGLTHEAAPTWRAAAEIDEGREPEVLIEAVPRG